jgi:hypothetical protein
MFDCRVLNIVVAYGSRTFAKPSSPGSNPGRAFFPPQQMAPPLCLPLQGAFVFQPQQMAPPLCLPAEVVAIPLLHELSNQLQRQDTRASAGVGGVKFNGDDRTFPPEFIRCFEYECKSPIVCG